MKIVLINTLYPPDAVGGAERVVQTLARMLVRRGDQVTVLCLSEQGVAGTDFDEGVKVLRVPLRNLYWPFGIAQPSAPARLAWHAIDSFNLAAARTVDRVLREEAPDVVHTHNLAGFSTRAWNAIKALGLPLVHTLHDYYLLCPRSTMYGRDGNCVSPCGSCAGFSLPRRTASALVDSVAGVSRFVLERHVAEGMFSEHAARHVVHNGLTHAWAAPALPPSPRPSTSLLRIGYMGRIEANKGIEALLEATNALRPGSWQLNIAGKGDAAYLAQLRERHPSPAIVYLGFTSPQDFFGQLDLLVVPSLWNEPLGMVAFEAFFFGVPVVASRRGGLPEIVTPEAGMLFDPDSPSSLAEVLAALQADPARLAALAEGALRAAPAFLPEHMCDAYQAIYRRLGAPRTDTGAPLV